MSLDERFFQLHGYYPGVDQTPTPAPLPPHVTRAAIMAVLDQRLHELEHLAKRPMTARGRAVIGASIRTLFGIKAELTVLIECPPACLRVEDHWRAEDAHNNAEAERHYRIHVDTETD